MNVVFGLDTGLLPNQWSPSRAMHTYNKSVFNILDTLELISTSAIVSRDAQ